MPCYEQLIDWNQSGKCETNSNTRLKKIKSTSLLEFFEDTHIGTSYKSLDHTEYSSVKNT